MMRHVVMLIAVVLAVAGCAGLQAQDSAATERMLAEAGFQMKPADTAEKLAHLRTLTPGKIVRQEVDGKTYYVFAGRTRCECLYAGTESQYERYRALIRQRTAAAEAVVATEDASDFRLWGLGPWP